MLELRIQTGKRRYVAPHALREAIGAERALREIGDMIEYLMAELDMIEGDPDVECNGDLEPDGDGMGDIAWVEWSSRAGRHHGAHETMAMLPDRGIMHEDDEEDDPTEDDDPREQDDEDSAVDDANCDAEGGREPIAALSWGLDQSEPLAVDPHADSIIMTPHRDRIRANSYRPFKPWGMKGLTMYQRRVGSLEAINAN